VNAAHDQVEQDITARFTYTTELLAPAKTYVNNAADAARELAVNLAKAERDRIVNEDYSGNQSAVQQAYQQYNQRMDSYRTSYSTTQGTKLAIRLQTEADTAHVAGLAKVNAIATRRTTDANAQYEYQKAVSTQYASLTAQEALLDKNYAIFEASSLKAKADTLATGSSATP